MRVVADTNIVVSGLLWNGAPRKVLDLARTGQITLYSSPDLLAEFQDVIGRDKFIVRLKAINITVKGLTVKYNALANLFHPVSTPQVIKEDPDDDLVLACAMSANAEIIVSGDSHLLNLKTYQGISILTATELLEKFK